MTDASVYFDHPVHAPADHTLNVDLRNPDRGPSARVAVELDPASARALAVAILDDARLGAARAGPVVVATGAGVTPVTGDLLAGALRRVAGAEAAVAGMPRAAAGAAGLDPGGRRRRRVGRARLGRRRVAGPGGGGGG